MPEVEFTRSFQRKKSLADYLSLRVEKAFLSNLDTGETQSFLLNPAEFTESYRANYARPASPGLSHRRLQYVGSENTSIPFTAFYDQLVFQEKFGRKNPVGEATYEAATTRAHLAIPSEVEDFRRFLISLVMPRKGKRLISVSPPPMLFVWPGMIDMRVRIESATFKHILFKTGRPEARAYAVTLQITEAPLERIFSEDVRRLGTHRPWASREL